MVDIAIGSNILNQLRPTNFSNARVTNQTGTNNVVQNQARNQVQNQTSNTQNTQNAQTGQFQGLFDANTAPNAVQNAQQNNRVQAFNPNDRGRAETQAARQAVQDRQEQLIEGRVASQAQQATAAEAGRDRAALKDRTESIRVLQETRSLDTEQLQRNLQASTELARYDRERQDAITDAVRSSEAQPRGSIIDVLG
ncbi:MAG: hypothetical protein COB46_08310 [Rhodospirillaceae bacterium]|nr:MAG: hypothetical protein COB46_08310 [Rhodospirillaceae bacterium]